MLIMNKVYHFDPLLLHWMPFSYGYMFFLGGLAYYFRNKLNTSFIFLRLNISKKFISDSILITMITLLILSGVTLMSFKYFYLLIEIGFVFGTFLIIIFFNNNGELSKILNNRLLVFLGSISFSFYLIHYIIIGILPKVNVDIFDFFIQFYVSIIISFVWYFILEKVIYGEVKKLIKKL